MISGFILVMYDLVSLKLNRFRFFLVLAINSKFFPLSQKVALQNFQQGHCFLIIKFLIYSYYLHFNNIAYTLLQK